MAHTIHPGPRRIFDDSCNECVSRSQSLDGLGALDPINLVKLAGLATEMKETHEYDFPPGASRADVNAAELLRQAARLVFASGITEQTAR